MLKVGLTGGIACGKTNTLRQFNKLGAFTIDADQIAREVVKPGQPAYREIVDVFSTEILKRDKTIDRKKLGKVIFSDEAARQKLNKIIHPRVFEEERRLISSHKAQGNNRSPLAIVDAALMVEAGSYRRYDFVIVVYCHPSIQLKRLISRDGLSEEEALQRIDSQIPMLEKVKYGDYIIENSSKLSDTNQQIRQTFAELMNLYEESTE